MKNNLRSMIWILASISLATSPARAQKVAYYVSTTGNDSNPGTFLQPLATVAGAEGKLAANYLNNCRAQTAPIIVQFRKGTSYDQNINLTHSGCYSVAPQGEVEALDFELWDMSRERISCIDTTRHIIYLTGSTTSGYAHGYIAGHRYLVENVKDDLSIPGQWYLDRSVAGAWVLHYLANPGERPDSDTVVIPQQAQALTGNNLKFRTFVGLTFAHDNYVVGAKGYPGSEIEPFVPACVL